jgi:hypothetical protein
MLSLQGVLLGGSLVLAFVGVRRRRVRMVLRMRVGSMVSWDCRVVVSMVGVDGREVGWMGMYRMDGGVDGMVV